MKCDELNAYKGDMTIPVYGTIADARVYLKEEVDAAIAELKAKLPCWKSVDECFPSAGDGYFLILWDDGLPDIGYIGAEDDVIETVRDLSDGHSVEWWMPFPLAPKEAKRER